MVKRVEDEFGSIVLRFRWPIILLTLVFLSLTGYGMQFLQFSNDSRTFFSKDNPQLIALEALENTFSKNDNVIFAIAPGPTGVFTSRVLEAIEELTEKSWQIPYSSRVDSLTNFQHSYSEDDDLIVENLVSSPRSLTPAEMEKIKEIAVNEPLLVNRLVSPDGRVAGINISFVKPGKSLNETPEIAKSVKELRSQFHEKYPSIALYVGGGIMIDNAFGEVAQEDMSTLVPFMYGALLLAIALLLRSFMGTVGTLLVILFSVITALGIWGWMGLHLTPASANAPTIILTLAVADSIHVLATLFFHMRHGKEKEDAIKESLRVNIQPVFLTSVTTAIGFLTMNFSDAPPFRDLGNVVAMGVLAAFLYSVTFLPALLSLLPLRQKEKRLKGSLFFDSLGDFVATRKNPIFWSMLALTVLLSAGTFRIELDDNFIEYFDERYDFRRASDFIKDNLTGLDIIDYTLNSGEEGGVNDPVYLNTIEKFAQWYRQHPKVAHVSVFTDTIKRLNRNMHGDDQAYYKIPQNRELAAQYLLLYEMSLPFGLDLNDQINVDKSSTRMTVTLKETTAKEIRQLELEGRKWLEANAPPEMFVVGSGLSVMFAYISERNIESMLGGSILALFLISGLMIIALKSFKMGMVSLLPNLLPAFMAFGVWGFTVGQVGLAVSVMIALTLGIVVDDTVHFMSKYLRARRELNKSPEEAVRYSFHSVGPALFITTAVLVAGFSVLALSGFKVNSDMGTMTSITIALALFLDFLLLPTLLIKLETKEDEQESPLYEGDRELDLG